MLSKLYLIQRYPIFYSWVTTLCISFLLCLVVSPTQTYISEYDVIFAWGTMGIFIASVIVGLVSNISYASKDATSGVNWLDVLVGIGSLYYILHTCLKSTYPCEISYLKFIQLVILYFSLRYIMSRSNWSSSWINCSIIFCVVYEWGLGIYQALSRTSRHHLYLLTGSFQNPGPYSAMLLMGTVIGLIWLLEMKKGRYKKLLMVLVTFMFSLLPATMSRAAFVSFIFIILYVFKKHYWQWRWYIWLMCIIVLIIIYYLKQGSADGRLLIWIASLTMCKYHPWVGVGLGGSQQTISNGIAELYTMYPNSSLFNSGGVTKYAFNDLLTIFVEYGAIGLCICISIIISVLYILRQHNKALFYGILSILLFSLFSYPFELLPFQIIIVIVTAWVASIHKQTFIKKLSYRWVTLLLFLILPMYMIAKKISMRYDADKNYQTFAGITNEAFIKDYYKLLPLENENAGFLFDFAKALRNCGRYRDSNAILRMGTKVSTDPMFYVIMGNNYKDEGLYELAEWAYVKAFAIMPNRMYPLYQLMRLYECTGDMAKCKTFAHRIIAIKPKIESLATEEMRKHAIMMTHQ